MNARTRSLTIVLICCCVYLFAACGAPEPANTPTFPPTQSPTAESLSPERRKTYTLSANPDKHPITASTAIGEIEFTVLQPPPGIEIHPVISTPHGLAAVFHGEGGGVCWSTTGEVWECDISSHGLWQMFTTGDHLYVRSYQGVLRFSWDEDGWVKDTIIDIPLSHVDHLMFSPHGALAANSTHVVYSRDGLHFKKAAHGPRRDRLPEAEKSICHPSRESWGRNINGPMLLVTEEGFIALTPAHADNWHRKPFCEPLLWFSEDGNDWNLISDESPFGETGYIHDILHIEDRFVALGGQDSHGGAVWFSDDGLTWDMADVRMGDTSAIAAGDIGWVLTGHSPFLWVSKDGNSWHGPYTLPRDLQPVYSIPPTLAIWSDRIFGAGVKAPVLGEIRAP